MIDKVVADIEAIRARAQSALDGAQGNYIHEADEEVKQLGRDVLLLLSESNSDETREIVRLRVALLDMQRRAERAEEIIASLRAALARTEGMTKEIRTVVWNRTLNACGGVGQGEKYADYVLAGLDAFLAAREERG